MPIVGTKGMSMSIVHVHLEVEVISVMTLVEDRMARPGGGEGPNHLWNHPAR